MSLKDIDDMMDAIEAASLRTRLAAAERERDEARAVLADREAGERFAREYGHEVERAHSTGRAAGLREAAKQCDEPTDAASAPGVRMVIKRRILALLGPGEVSHE